jgi:hypothetical protein
MIRANHPGSISSLRGRSKAPLGEKQRRAEQIANVAETLTNT